MGQSIRSWLVVSVSILLSTPCIAGPQTEEAANSGLRTTVRVFNYAGASTATWRLAQIIAARIYDGAGIETVWMFCTLSSEGQYLPPDCALPPKPDEIILRLVPTSRSTRAHFGNATLGIAAPSEVGTQASVSVFYDRVEELAKGGVAPVAVILGHVAAHEIGHLLLGSNSDSSLGLMCGRWNRASLALANDGQLNFRSREIAKIQNAVRIRRGTVTSVPQETAKHKGDSAVQRLP